MRDFRRKVEPKKLSCAGFSLVEVMVAAGLTGIVALGVTSLVTTMSSMQAQGNLTATLQVLKKNIEYAARDTTAWAETVAEAGNTEALSEMDCLRDYTIECPTAGGPWPFILKRPNDEVVFDGIAAANNADGSKPGFTVTGVACNTWSSAGNNACPISYELTWRPLCPTAPAECKNPVIEIKANLRVAMANQPAVTFTAGVPAANVPALNPASYSVSLVRGRGENVRYEPILITYTMPNAAGEGPCTSSMTGHVVRRLNSPAKKDVGGNVVSISGTGSFTLKAGTYECRVSAPAWKVGAHVLRLVSTSGTTYDLASGVASSSRQFPSISTAVIEAVLDLNTDTTFELRHTCEALPAAPGSADPNYSLGLPVPDASGAYSEVTYSTVACVRTA